MLDGGDAAGDATGAAGTAETGGAAGTTSAAAATDRDNVFEATVEYLEFLGSFARAELGSHGGRLLMDLPIAQVRRHDVRGLTP